MQENEIWKEFKPHYEISNLGRLRNTSKLNRILKPHMDKAGYIYYQLDKIYLAHRLVAQAFIDNPDNKPHVHHKNDIRHDSRADNLEWTTIQENLNYINRGLSQPELDKIQALLSLYKKNEVAKQLNIY